MTKRPFRFPRIRLPDFHPVEVNPVPNGSVSNLLAIATGSSKKTLMFRFGNPNAFPEQERVAHLSASLQKYDLIFVGLAFWAG